MTEVTKVYTIDVVVEEQEFAESKKNSQEQEIKRVVEDLIAELSKEGYNKAENFNNRIYRPCSFSGKSIWKQI